MSDSNPTGAGDFRGSAADKRKEETVMVNADDLSNLVSSARQEPAPAPVPPVAPPAAPAPAASSGNGPSVAIVAAILGVIAVIIVIALITFLAGR